jgi:nucleotide-binding universal stress UspA family protein
VLEFTHDYHETIDRLADQYDCEAVFTPGEEAPVERVLVPLRGGTNVARILTLVESVVQGTDVRVTLFHAVDSGADRSEGEFFIRGAADWLTDEGIDRDRIDWQLSEGSDPKTVIADLAEVYDLLVLGETEPTLRERLLGEVPIRIIEAIEKPTLVVRGVA